MADVKNEAKAPDAAKAADKASTATAASKTGEGYLHNTAKGPEAPVADTTPKPAGPPSNNASEPPKNAPPGPQSTKSLVPGNTAGTVKDQDEGTKSALPGNGQEQPNNAAPNNSAPSHNQPPITPADDSGVQNYRQAPQPSEDDSHNQNELTREEEQRLEAIFDQDDPETDPDRPAVQRGLEPSAITKIRKIVSAIPQDTPNEHVVWGAAGVTLNVGDFRELVRAIA